MKNTNSNLNVHLAEAEKYFKAKNARRAWWSKNWPNFFLYPFFGVVIALAFIVVCVIIFNVGMIASKRDVEREIKRLIRENPPTPQIIYYQMATPETNMVMDDGFRIIYK